MIEVVNTPESSNPVRVISTTPRERWEGHWQRGRKYPLYAVVENNGSKFMSLTGNMKEEPYVLYNADTETFSANDGWVIKEMSADSRLTALGGNAAAGLDEVTASVDDVGAQVLVTYGGPSGHKSLDFAFSGLKGKTGNPGPPGADGQQGPAGADGQPGQDGQDGQDGTDGVGFESVSTPSTADGTATITLTNGDTITLDLNHQHPQYPKYVLCEDENEYESITTKDPGTLYLILEEES